MEYLLFASVTLLIACCVVALVLEPPAKIGERSSADRRKGSGARRSGQPGRSRHESAKAVPAVPSPGPVGPGPNGVSSELDTRGEALPADRCGRAVLEGAPPYSPQELRNLLDRHSPASSRAS